VSFYSTLFIIFFRKRYVSWPRKVFDGEGTICFNQGGMFNGYHDARRPLLRPCSNKGKTPVSYSYKSQMMYCTREGRKKKTREERWQWKENERRAELWGETQEKNRHKTDKKREKRGENETAETKKTERRECKEERGRGSEQDKRENKEEAKPTEEPRTGRKRNINRVEPPSALSFPERRKQQSKPSPP
jgi:hypothetical protein